MKSLLLPVLVAVLALPAASQTMEDAVDSTRKAVKSAKKAAEEAIKNAKDAAAGSVVEGAGAGDARATNELEALLLETGWKKDAADNERMSAGLKTKYRILNRVDPVHGKEYAVLVPRSEVPGGQLVYRSILTMEDGTPRNPPLRLVRVRAVEHLLALEFDQQQQYVSLNEPDPRDGFRMKGFVHTENGEKAARRFSDIAAIEDALETHFGGEGSKALIGLKERVRTLSGGKPYSVEASRTQRGFIVVLESDGKVHQLYPGPK